jgi:lysophospholipase L1-like esterase
MMNHRLRGIIVGLGLLLSIEVVVRLAIPEEDLLFSWEHPDGIIDLMGDQVYLRRSTETTGTDGPYPWKIVTNSLGLRENEESSEHIPEGSQRYLAVGDSWMFGTSVTQGKTIPDQLEVALTAATGQPTEVLNAAIPGGSAFEMLSRWQELSGRLELDGVIMGIPHNAGRQKDLSSVRESMFGNGGGAPYINIRTYLALRRAIAPYTRPRYASLEHTRGIHDAGMLQDLVTITSQAREQGLPVWVIEFPDNMNFSVGRISPIDQRWRDELEPMGAVFVGHALNTRSCWGFNDHGHPGESGANAIAQVVANTMVTDQRPPALQTEPSCDAVDGVGPGKPGWVIPE